MSSSLGHAASSPTKKGSIADLVHQTQPNLPQVNGCNTSNLHCSEQVAHSPTPTIFQPPASVAMQGSSTHQHPCISAGPTQFFSPPRLLRPVPSKHAANYASFTTALLTAAEIEAHWDDSPIMINQVAISNNAPEDEFSEAIQRLWVNVGFRDRVRRNSVIDFGRNYSNYMPKFTIIANCSGYDTEGDSSLVSNFPICQTILKIPFYNSFLEIWGE